MAFTEALHKRGMGAQGGQFVASDGTKSAALGYDGKRGSGYGSKGGDANVKKLQKELNRLGITDAQGKQLTVDGKFGPKTTAAVRRLQQKLKLPVDGKITPGLLKRMGSIKPSTHDQHAMHERHLKATGQKKAPAAKKVSAHQAHAAHQQHTAHAAHAKHVKAAKAAPAKKAAAPKPTAHQAHAAHQQHAAHAAHAKHVRAKKAAPAKKTMPARSTR